MALNSNSLSPTEKIWTSFLILASFVFSSVSSYTYEFSRMFVSYYVGDSPTLVGEYLYSYNNMYIYVITAGRLAISGEIGYHLRFKYQF